MDSSDEQRRAMNKSFTESGNYERHLDCLCYIGYMLIVHLSFWYVILFVAGGTVLSTNWNEVGGDKVQVRPPDGTEFRPWD